MGLLAVANSNAGSVSVFSVSAGGALTPVSGSPFATTRSPFSVAFSPGGRLLATSNAGAGTVSALSVGPPMAAISSPADAQSYGLNQSVSTAFGCADATGGPGIVSCTDSNATSSPAGRLDTSTLGTRSYKLHVKPPIATPVAPTLTHVGQSHSAWRESNPNRHARHSKRPLGTTFSFTLNESAKVTLSFTQRCGGRKITVGTLTVWGHAGKNSVSSQGHASHGKLKPGRYTLLIAAANAAGQRSKTASLSFTIVSR